jgi:catechol 2,3-dioxygenase-like lactoylglutathione lyase family enzyme
MLQVEQIDHVALTVTDVERSMSWYAEVLGLRQDGDWLPASGDPAFMAAGSTSIALFPVRGEGLSPGWEAIAMQHLAFRIDRKGFDKAEEELRARGLDPRFADHGNAHSYYFSDPDGHTLELTTYEI